MDTGALLADAAPDAGAVGLLITALVLGLRHGIDWDHIAAITDITSTTAASGEPREEWLTDEPGLLLTDEADHVAAEVARRRPVAGGSVVAGTLPARVGAQTGIRLLWGAQRRAVWLGSLYALGHGTVGSVLGLLAILAA